MPGQHDSSPQISVLTFNMLAPCYKRMYSADKRPIGREQRFHDLWTNRLDSILKLLLSIQPTPDVIALQEFWFNPHFQKRFEAAVDKDFHIFYHQRPGAKEDGLATLIHRNSPAFTRQVPRSHTFSLGCDRVGLAVSVSLASTSPVPQADLLVVNAHLTFPHSVVQEAIRPAQADKLTNFVDQHVKNSPNTTHALVLGDFNGDDTSSVCHRMLAQGFENCYTKLNGPTDKPTTHYNHRKQEVFVDHIFLRSIPAQVSTRSNRRSTINQSGSSLASRSSDLLARCYSSSPVGIRDMQPNSARRDSDKLSSQLTQAASSNRPMSICCCIEPVSTAVYPESLPTDGWPKTFDISDHRPLRISFRQIVQPIGEI